MLFHISLYISLLHSLYIQLYLTIVSLAGGTDVMILSRLNIGRYRAKICPSGASNSIKLHYFHEHQLKRFYKIFLCRGLI